MGFKFYKTSFYKLRGIYATVVTEILRLGML